MSSGAAQLPRQRGGTCRHRGAVIGCRAPQTLQPERGLGRPAGGRRRRGRRGCPDAGHAVRRSLRRADIRPPGRADVQCPGVRCPRDRCDPGVRTDRCPDRQASGVRGRCVRAVRTALDPGRRCRGTGHVWRTGFDVSLWSPSGLVVAARMRPGWEEMVVRWQCVAGTSVDGTWTAASQSQAAASRSPPGRPRERVQRQGAGRWLGSTRGSRCSRVPRRYVLGRLPACCSTMGLNGRW
jgi:hypothetical protein